MFTQTATQFLNVVPGESVSLQLNLTGNPTVAYLSAGVVGSTPLGAQQFVGSWESLNGIFYALGDSSVTASETAGAVLKPGYPAIGIPITSSGPTYIAIYANNSSDNGINISLCVLS